MRQDEIDIRVPAAIVVLLTACFEPENRDGADGSSGQTAAATDTMTTSESTAQPTDTTATSSTSIDESTSETSTTSTSDTSSSLSESSSDSSTGEPPRRCDPKAPFGDPEAIEEVNSASVEQGAWLTADELTMYLDSTRPGGEGQFDIWVATRASTAEDFGDPVVLPAVNTTSHDADAVLTEDGLRLYASQHDGANWNIVGATRDGTDEDFGPLSAVPGLNAAGLDSNPFVALDGSLYFNSDRQGAYDLFYARWNGAGFEEPELVPGDDLASDVYDVLPVLAPDELTLYFTSNREGGTGGYDIYVAIRASTDEPFESAVEIAELDTANDDVLSWASADGCEVLMYRHMPAVDADDILVARRGP